MNFAMAIRTALRKYADFTGRARRSEFWWFVLFYAMVTITPPVLISGVAMVTAASTSSVLSATELVLNLVVLGTFFAWFVAQVALLVPGLAVTARRLHDRDLSGWLQLLAILPFGGVVVVALTAVDSTPGPNAYGPNPKESSAAGVDGVTPGLGRAYGQATYRPLGPQDRLYPPPPPVPGERRP